MIGSLRKLICLLSDGEVHSGTLLGQKLGLTRAGVWKLVKQLEALDVLVVKKTNRGYQIPGGIEFLSAEKVIAALPPHIASAVEIIIEQNVTSTNDYLLQHQILKDKQFSVCIAERQSEGRGRFKRKWCSPYGRNLYFSFRWEFSGN